MALKEAKLNPEQRKRIDKDLDALASDLKSLITEPGPSMSFCFLTGQGYESYGYDWGEHKDVDGSKPLTLLNHVGGDPILAVVGRGKHSPEQYQMMVKWLKVIAGYVDELVIPQLEEPEREKYAKFMKNRCRLC